MAGNRGPQLTELQKYYLYRHLMQHGMKVTARLFKVAADFNPPSRQTEFQLEFTKLLHNRAMELFLRYTPESDDDDDVEGDPPRSVSSGTAVVDHPAGSPREVYGCSKWLTNILLSVLVGYVIAGAFGDLRFRVRMMMTFVIFFTHLACSPRVVVALYVIFILGGYMFFVSQFTVSAVTSLIQYEHLLRGYLHPVLRYLHLMLGYLPLVMHMFVVSIIVFFRLRRS